MQVGGFYFCNNSHISELYGVSSQVYAVAATGNLQLTVSSNSALYFSAQF